MGDNNSNNNSNQRNIFSIALFSIALCVCELTVANLSLTPRKLHPSTTRGQYCITALLCLWDDFQGKIGLSLSKGNMPYISCSPRAVKLYISTDAFSNQVMFGFCINRKGIFSPLESMFIDIEKCTLINICYLSSFLESLQTISPLLPLPEISL